MLGLPCAAVLSSKIEKQSLFWSPIFSHPTFRTYIQEDPIGVQIGGALKNVIAIASGILTGLGGSENARAALLTRGLAEMVRFGTAYGAHTKTFMGLSGIGDLMLTATSEKSRNFSLGFSIGQGSIDHSHGVKEGSHTVSILMKKAQEKDIFMPISEAVYQILHNHTLPKKSLEELMVRPPKAE
jgi:glycerol-3-phosphate dehydrogenase (NAD(P)+)